MRSKTWIFCTLLALPAVRHAQGAPVGPQNFNFDGVLLAPGGIPVTDDHVNFRFEIMDKASTCVLYSEFHLNQDLSQKAGAFSLKVGTGTSAANLLKGGSEFTSALFVNAGSTGAFSGCSPGVIFAPGDERLLRVSYALAGGATYTTLTPPMPLSSVPTAMVADSLQGRSPTDMIQVNTGSGKQLTQANVEYVFGDTTKVGHLKDLVDGVSTQYMVAAPTTSIDFNNQKIVNLSAPTGANDAVNKTYSDTKLGGLTIDPTGVGTGVGGGKTLVWDQAASKWVTATAGGVSSVSAGPGLLGGTITSNGSFSVDTGVTANKIVALNGSGQLPAVNGSLLTNLNAYKLQARNLAATAPSNGDVITWNNTNSQWEPAAPSGGGGISALTGDVTASGVGSVGATIVANAVTAAKIANGAIIAAKIPNDTITSNHINSAGVAVNRLLMTDASTGTTVAYSTCANGEMLKYSTATGWGCSNINSAGITFPVTSVAGRTGAITLTSGDIPGLGTAAVENVGTTALKVVQLNGAAQLPAVDGSLLTAVNASKLANRNVAATAPTANQVLAWNSIFSSWEPKNVLMPAPNGNVGIGTAAPGQNLSVYNTVANGANAVQIENPSPSGASRLIVVDDWGGASSMVSLEAYGSSLNYGNFGSGNVRSSSGASLFWEGAGGPLSIAAKQSYLRFYTNGEFAANERMRIDTNGNVGIGTTSPMGILDVQGGMAPASTPGQPINLIAQSGGSGNQNGGSIILNPGSPSGAGQFGVVMIGAPGQSYPAVLRASFNNSSTAGINFEVQAGDAGSGTDLGGGALNLKSGTSTGANSSSIRFYTAQSGTSGTTFHNPTQAMVISGGNVGIGTTSPSGMLSVGGAPLANANFGLVSIGNGLWDSTGGAYIGNVNGTVLAVNVPGSFSGDLMNLQLSGASKFSVNSSGNVTLAGGSTITTSAGSLTVSAFGSGTTTIGGTGGAAATLIQGGSTGKIKLQAAGSTGTSFSAMGWCSITGSAWSTTVTTSQTCSGVSSTSIVTCSGASLNPGQTFSVAATGTNTVNVVASGTGSTALNCIYMTP